MRTANYSELRANMKHYLDGVIRDNEPLVVHRQGSESVVIMSLEDYNSMAETEYLMRSPAMIDAIRQGENDIENGRFSTMEDNESPEEFLSRCTE